MAAQRGVMEKLKFWKRGDKVVSPDEARTRLQNLMDMLQKKSGYLEAKIEEETQTALKNRTKNKRGALMALRRRKRWQKQLTDTDNTMNTVEVQLANLNDAHMNTEIIRTMRQSSVAVRQAHNGLSVEEVQDLKDEMDEMMEDSQQITDLLATPLGGDSLDEDDLMAELEELEQEDLTESLTAVDLDLPSVPTHEVKVKPKVKPRKLKKSKEELEEEEDLRKLAEWM